MSISSDDKGRYHVKSDVYVSAVNWGCAETGAILFDGPSDFGESASFVFADGERFVVSVEQEQAVDSYNEWFNCSVGLSIYQAAALRDWLTGMLRDVPPVLLPPFRRTTEPHDS